jgi:hypothetical protein
MSSAHWSLAQVITWIITRDETAVAEAPDAVAHLSLLEGLGKGLGGDLDAARQELWHQLQLGTITATGKDHDNERRTISAERWQDLVAVLHGKTEVLQLPGIALGPAFTAVTVTTITVRKLWPPVRNAAQAKRGPKPKVDPIQFEQEVHRYIAENGMPDPTVDPLARQADLEEHMMQWHGDTLGMSRNRVLVSAAMQSYLARNSAD